MHFCLMYYHISYHSICCIWGGVVYDVDRVQSGVHKDALQQLARSYIIHHTSYITQHTSYIIHDTSYTTHHTSYTIHLTSYIRHYTSYIVHHTSYIIYHTSYIIHHISYSTHHTSYIIHHTSHIMHHTSHKHTIDERSIFCGEHAGRVGDCDKKTHNQRSCKTGELGCIVIYGILVSGYVVIILNHLGNIEQSGLGHRVASHVEHCNRHTRVGGGECCFSRVNVWHATTNFCLSLQVTGSWLQKGCAIHSITICIIHYAPYIMVL